MEIARRQHLIDLKQDARRIDSRAQLGQAMVELALLMPIFLLLILGSAEFARLAYAAIEVSNAARAGAAYGAQSGYTAAQIGNIQLAATSDGSNITTLTATATTFCTCSTGGSVVCTNAVSCVSPARVIEFVQVNTTANVNPLIHVPGLPNTFTLRGQAIMRVLGP